MSNLQNIDLFIISIFLLGTLVVGCFAGRKTSSMRDYAIANRSFTPAFMAMTLIATQVGGISTTGNIAKIYEVGFIHIVAQIGECIGLFYLTKFAVKYLSSKYSNLLSIADIIDKEYGELPGKICALLSTLKSIIIVSAQILALGHIAVHYVGISYQMGVLLSSSIFIIYSTFGGIRGVVITDVMQFIVMIIIIPMVAILVLNKAGGLEYVIAQVPSDKTKVFEHIDFTNNMYLFFVYAMPFYLLSATFIQRVLMCNDVSSISNMGYSYVVMRVLFLFFISCIALSAFVLLPEGVDGNAVVPYLINESIPSGYRGFIIAGLFAILMSTADSNLNTGSILLVKNLFQKKKNEILWLRCSTVFIGITSAIIALNNFKIIPIWILITGVVFCGVNIPLFLGTIFKKKTNVNYYASLLVGLTVCVIGITIGAKEYQITINLIFCSILAWFICYNKWYVVPPEAIIKKSVNFIFKIMQDFIAGILRSMHMAYADISSVYRNFAYICIAYYLLPFIFLDNSSTVPELLYYKLFMVLLCCTLLFADKLRTHYPRLFTTFWYCTVYLALPNYCILMLFKTGVNIIWIANAATAAILMVAVLDYLILIIMVLFGIITVIANDYIFTQSIPLLYSCYSFVIMLVISSLLFKRKKEELAFLKTERMQEAIRTTGHESKAPLTSLKGNIEKYLKQGLIKDKETKDLIIKDIKKVQAHISAVSSLPSIKDTERESISLKEIIDNTIDSLILEEHMYEAIEIMPHDIDKEVYTYRHLIQRVLTNILINAQKYTANKLSPSIKIDCIRNDNGMCSITITDNGEGIEDTRIHNIFEQLYTTDFKNGSGIGLFFCKSQLENIDGKIEVESEYGSYTKIKFSFPWK